MAKETASLMMVGYHLTTMRMRWVVLEKETLTKHGGGSIRGRTEDEEKKGYHIIRQLKSEPARHNLFLFRERERDVSLSRVGLF